MQKHALVLNITSIVQGQWITDLFDIRCEIVKLREPP
jgi:hypothetical protein